MSNGVTIRPGMLDTADNHRWRVVSHTIYYKQVIYVVVQNCTRVGTLVIYFTAFIRSIEEKVLNPNWFT